MESLERKDASVATEEPVKSEGPVIPSPTTSDRSNGGISPPPHCSICLGKLVNTSFTDSCLHQFCFTCLLQWAKIKTECPLCKQTFKSIIHNVRSEGDYDQYHVQYTSQVAAGTLDVTADIHINRPWPLFANRPFMYRRFGVLLNPEAVARREQIPSIAPTLSSEERRSRAEQPLEFRRRIYRTGVWATPLPDGFGRYRQWNSTFYRHHPDQVQRLVPWLNRELMAVMTEQHHIVYVLDRITEALTRVNITSNEFRDIVRPYLGIHTEHFQHEFANFARSNFDMVGYDQTVTYIPYRALSALSTQLVTRDISTDTSSSDSSSSDSEVRVVSDIRNYHIPGHLFIDAPGPSSFVSGVRNVEPDIVTVSSASSESDGECEVVGVVKPRHERTPEIIDLSSADEGANENSPSTSQGINASESTLPKEEDINLPSTSTGASYLNASRSERSRRRAEDGTKPLYDYMDSSSASDTDELDSDYNPSSKSKSRRGHKSTSKKSSKSSSSSSRKLRSRAKSTSNKRSSRKKRSSKSSSKRSRSLSYSCSEDENDPSPPTRGVKRYLSKSSDNESDYDVSSKKSKKSKKSKTSRASKRRCLLIPTSKIPKARIYTCFSSDDGDDRSSHCPSSCCSDCDGKFKSSRKRSRSRSARRSVSYDFGKNFSAPEDYDKPSCSTSTGAIKKMTTKRENKHLVDYDTYSEDERTPRHSSTGSDDDNRKSLTKKEFVTNDGNHSDSYSDENDNATYSRKGSKNDKSSCGHTSNQSHDGATTSSSSKCDSSSKHSESSSSSSKTSTSSSRGRRRLRHKKCKESKTRRRSRS